MSCCSAGKASHNSWQHWRSTTGGSKNIMLSYVHTIGWCGSTRVPQIPQSVSSTNSTGAWIRIKQRAQLGLQSSKMSVHRGHGGQLRRSVHNGFRPPTTLAAAGDGGTSGRWRRLPRNFLARSKSLSEAAVSAIAVALEALEHVRSQNGIKGTGIRDTTCKHWY